MMQKIKSGDEVILIAGKDKGRTGKVLRVVEVGKEKKRRVVVEGLNLVKEHVRPNPQKNIQGGIIEKEAALDVSNVAIYNAKTKKADRVGIKVLKDGKKVRVFKSNNEEIDV
ncbi:MAG TPA: 50S ribosomal protein L24 [Coxiellaceae bacterium]|nr:50S ribosomal protein L24 [Coxiellaceae bacterium]